VREQVSESESRRDIVSDKTRSGECSCHRCLTRLVIDIFHTGFEIPDPFRCRYRLESGESIVLSGNSTPLSQVIGLVQAYSDPYY